MGIETTGNGANSSETFVAYDGDKSLKMWNAGGENNVFQEMVGDPLVGTIFNLCFLYSHADDFIQGGGTFTKITGPNGE